MASGPAEDAGKAVPAGSRTKKPSARVEAPSEAKAEALRGIEGSTQRFTHMGDSLPIIVWTATAEGEVDYFNAFSALFTGVPVASLVGEQWLSTLHPDDVAPTVALWVTAVTTAKPYEVNFRVRRADGEYRWHHVRAEAELDDRGHVLRWWGSGIDVHALRLVEAQAAQLAADREAILESIGDGVFTLDHEWRFTYLNHNAERLIERDRDVVIGAVFWDEFPETVGSDLEELFTRVVATGQPERMEDYASPMKLWFDLSVNASPDGLTVYVRDITQVKNLSEQLAIAHRMDALGHLTGGIAHDFNNLLTVVIGGTESLAEEESLSAVGRDMLDLVSQAATRGADLTHRLLAFARRQPLAPRAIDVILHVHDLIPLLERTLGERVEIVEKGEIGLPAAVVDPGELQSAVINLAINARDAMPDGGVLTLEASVMHVEEPYPTLFSEILPGTYVLVSVTDTGTGIPAEDLSRIFDPFYTTKTMGQGSGLGLAMVWGFLRQSGGHVTVYSEVGKGTVFHLYLPAAPAGAALALPTSPAAALLPGAGHILLVEDDALVRQFATAQLIARGYTVTAASSGAEALELLGTIEHLNLLFTDVIMPGGMTGKDLAMEIAARRPGTPVLYASGYTQNVNLQSALPDEDAPFLPKPYSSTQLVESIQRVMAPPTPESSLW